MPVIKIPGKSIRPPNTTCLVIAPFDAAGARVRDTIHRALDELEIDILSLENFNPGAAWVNAVTDAIKAADLIIVDISRENPNVMYELGYAHALRKPTFLLMSIDAKSSPPSDLYGYLYATYDPQNLRKLKEQVIFWVQKFKASGEKE